MNLLKAIPLFLSTIRYLKPIQITGQIQIRLKRRFEQPHKFLAKQVVPPYPGSSWNLKNDFLPPGPQINTENNMVKGWFDFLNSRQNVGWPPRWDDPETSKLWQYNLHYFEYLWSLDYCQARLLTSEWIHRHTLDSERVGWEAYPVSLRLINLCGLFFGKYSKEVSEDKKFLELLWESIFIQTQWLVLNLETHILGNHLFENAAALTFTGSCFSGKESQKWFDLGFELLKKEIQEQILSDGMHFELSPMYHCRITYLLSLLYTAGRPHLRQTIDAPLQKAVSALEHLIHPDGEIALLSDSAHQIYNSPSSLIAHCKAITGNRSTEKPKSTFGAFALTDSGYFGSKNHNLDSIICDLGPIGPDYLPAHGHADIFSYELSLKGHRIVVDSGVYDYEKSEMRNYCRSTKAHNTVEISGHNQCELWEIFRVGRRGKTFDIKWQPEENGGFIASGKHDGYKRLAGHPVHFREFKWEPDKKLLVTDEITSTSHQTAVSRIHLHPSCSIDSIEDKMALLNTPAGKVKISFSDPSCISIEKSFYCPQFGVKTDNICIAASYSGNRIQAGYVIEKL